MINFSDQELWNYIREDISYFDLTTHLLAPAEQKVILSIVTREEIVVACNDDAARIAELLGCKVIAKAQSGIMVKKGSTLLEIYGDGQSIHKAWKVCQVFLEHACALATHAHKMLTKAQSVNPDCEVLVTRKSFPFSKQFSIHALMCGGVMPHRLGVSESVLIFDHHRSLFENHDAFEDALKKIKKRCVENKLVVESQTLDDAKRMLQLGADVIQLDKCSADTVRELVIYKNTNFPNAAIMAAGGINMQNVADYAKTGVNALVTSALYSSSMSNLTTIWKKI
jgi:molybdenum transport protein